MIIKNGMEVGAAAIQPNIKRLINQIFKLLPSREENDNWEETLDTIIEEMYGMNRLLIDNQDITFSILCRLEGLKLLIRDDDFLLYRKTIFKCISLLEELRKSVMEEDCYDNGYDEE